MPDLTGLPNHSAADGQHISTDDKSGCGYLQTSHEQSHSHAPVLLVELCIKQEQQHLLHQPRGKGAELLLLVVPNRDKCNKDSHSF